MARRAERGPRPPRRFEPDRVWLLRAALAIVVALGLFAIARMSMLAFSGGSHRIERQERESEGRRAPAKEPVRPAS